MASITEICNRALIRLGADTITDISEQNSKEARLCNILYNQVRKELLRLHPWNFATKRQILAADVDDPDFEFYYSYSLPSDCIRVLKVNDFTSNFKIEMNKLLSDDDGIELIYIYDATDPTQFDTLFTSIFVLKLAMEMSYNITGATFAYGALQSEFNQLKREAKLFDAQEGIPDTWGDGDWLGSR
jgi:hypothetical protein